MSNNFSNFYEAWFDRLKHLVHQLVHAHHTPTTLDQHNHLQHLTNKLISHYTEYYKFKSLAIERDALTVLAAPWATALERSLHWMAGWRPTTVFHLIYSESSILFESHIIDILRGLRTGDLGDLSPSQFRRVSELQCETVKEENEITGDFSEWQDSASEMLVTELDGGGVSQKIGRLGFVLRKADDLRLRTIQSVVELLTPQQAVEFLIAAAELQFGIRAWGVNHDRTSISVY